MSAAIPAKPLAPTHKNESSSGESGSLDSARDMHSQLAPLSVFERGQTSSCVDVLSHDVFNDLTDGLDLFG